MIFPLRSSIIAVVLVASVFQKSTVYADIPVHCIQPDVIGLWRFHVGTFEGPAGPDSRCGFSAPDDPDGHHELTPPNAKSNPAKGNYFLTDKFKKSFSIEVLLRDWTSRIVSVDAAGKQHFAQNVEDMAGGEWTMIYDEGFHVNVGNDQEGQHSFIAFSKYMLGPHDSAGSTDNMANKQHSFCGNTLLGWYRQMDSSTGAIKHQQCWWGERIKPLHEALASLPASLAGPPVGLPPVLPLPLNGTGMAKPQPKPKAAKPQPSHGGFLRGDQANLDDSTPSEAVLKVEAAVISNAIDYDAIRRTLQAALVLVLSFLILAIYKLSTAEKPKEGNLFNHWHVVAVIGIITALGLGLGIWFATQPEQRAVSIPDVSQAAAAVNTPAQKKKTPIGEAADRLHAGLEEARQNGTAVHWQSNPEKFKKWLRERREKHGMNVHESSSVEELLDAITPPRMVGAIGFETEQVIGPVRAKAIKEQLEIANSKGKAPSQLTTKDVKDSWGSTDTNHHLKREFAMNGKTLTPEGWSELTDFDWRNVSLQMPNGKSISNFVNSVPDQGGCGSCYAVAATSMLTSRLMLKYPELHEKFAEQRGNDRISVDQQLACNHFNQGCSGGYPYLISAWSFGNDIVSQKCFEQSQPDDNKTKERWSRRDTCVNDFKGEACQERFRVSNWRYLGGSLGRCGLHHLCEDAMREELYKGGPLAVSVEPTGGFGYSDGVYHGVSGMEDKGLLAEMPKKSDPDCKDAECYIWRKVDHSVLLVGWGEDLSKGKTCQPRVHRVAETMPEIPDAGCEQVNEQECAAKPECVFRGYPYWIIQNSYGPGFGREGYLYFGPRGQDPMRVESMTLAADVTWVNQPGSEDSGNKAALPKTSTFAETEEHEATA